MIGTRARQVCALFVRNIKAPVAPRWYLTAFGLGLSLSLILATGPQIQKHLIALVNSNANSIYATAYEESFAKFISLTEWISVGVSWPYPLMGWVIAFVALKYPKPRSLFSSVVATTWLALMTYDVINAFAYDQVTVEYFFENTLSNLIGSVVVGIIVVLLLITREISFEYMIGSSAIRTTVSLTLVAVGGLLFTTSTYYFLVFFYQPVPVQISILIDQPISGTVTSDHDAREMDSDSEVTPFTFIPHGQQASTYRWISPIGNLGADWMSLESSIKHDAVVELYAGCNDSESLVSKSNLQNSLKISDITRLAVAFDGGSSTLETLSNPAVYGVPSLETDETTLFWSSRDKSSGKLEIQQFVKDAKLTYLDKTGLIEFYLSAFLFGESEDIKESPRRLVIQTNKNSYSLLALPPKGVQPTDKVVCKSINANDAFKVDSFYLPRFSMIVGVLIRIQSRSIDMNVDDAGVVTFGGGDGWLTMHDVNTESLAQMPSGRIDFISFVGDISGMEIDGAAVAATPYDIYSILGKLDAKFDESARLRIQGSADVIQKESRRLNPTKWERLPWEARTVLGSLLAVLLIYAGRVFVLRVQNNKQLLVI